MNSQFVEAGRLLRNSKRVLFITGAGVSAESQIPTFRGATAAFANGMTEDGISFEEVLSSTTFIRDPKLCWKYLFRLELSMRGKEPNAAHLAMAALQTPARHVCVATQNIDGLHQRAHSKTVLELHGSLLRVICTRCDYLAQRETFESLPALPRCPQCDGILRPDVVLYEEPLSRIVMDAFDREQEKGFDMVFTIGTTSLFRYVAHPVEAAAMRGIPVVEINPEATPVSGLADFRFTGTAGRTLQQLLREAGA